MLLALQADATAQSIDLGVRIWRLDAGGQAAVGDAGRDGSPLDLQDDFGLRDDEDVLAASVELGDSHQVALAYARADFAGVATSADDMRIGEQLFPAGSRRSNSLDLTLLRVAYRYRAGMDAVRGGVLMGLQSVETEFASTARAVGSGDGRQRTLLPVIGAFASWAPAPFVTLSASLVGGTLDWSDESTSFVDAEGMVRVDAVPFFVGLGWRHLSLEQVDTDTPLDLDLTFNGPQLVGGIVF